MTKHQIKLIADGTDENDAVAMRQLRAYMTSEHADAKFALKSAVPSVEASDLRYVTRASLIDLNFLNQAQLPRRVAPLIDEAQTQTKAAIEARADRIYVRYGASQSVNMQRHRIRNLPNSPRPGDAVIYELLLEHSVKTLYLVKYSEIKISRGNLPILMKSKNCMVRLTLHMSANSAYTQQLFAIKIIAGEQHHNERPQAASADETIFLMYYEINKNFAGSRYRLTYLVVDFQFREIEPTREERAKASFQQHRTETQQPVFVAIQIVAMQQKKNALLYPSLDSANDERAFVAKLQVKNLFGKLDALEKELKHYQKLKRRYNSKKNILHQLKYLVCALMLDGDTLLLFTGLGGPVAIASSGLTLVELVSFNLIKDSVVRAKVNKYGAKVSHIKEWIDQMYVFKNQEFHDQIHDQKKIALWNSLLNQYTQPESSQNSTAAAEQAKNSELSIAKELK